MTETKAEYIVELSTNGEAVSCPACHAEKGQVIPIDGIEMLAIPGFIVTGIHGTCDQCGAKFHWTISDWALAKLVSSVLRRRT